MQPQLPPGATAYPGTEVVKSAVSERDWAVKDPGYVAGEYTAPAIAESADVDPALKAFDGYSF